MNVISISATSIEQLASQIKSVIHHQFQPTIAIGFSSPDFPFEDSLSIFRENHIELIGCTTSGEILDNAILSNTFSVLLMDFNRSYFKTVQFEHTDVEAYSSGEKLYEIADQTFQNPGIILFISGVRVVGDGPVEGIRKNITREIPIYGGLAGDNIQHNNTCTFTHESVSNFGVSALILDTDKIQMKGLAVSGWKPLGKTHTVTKADKNIIYEIDGLPALDLFLNYFGNIEYKLANNDGLYTIPGQYPLKIFQNDGTSYLRSLLIYDTENRALLAAGKINTGVNFKFCPPPDISVVDDTVRQFQEFSETFSDIDALVMVSCKGRHTSLGPMLEDEVKFIHEIWNVPMAGFLSNGEIGNSAINGDCAFHNVTCSLFSLKAM
ncbi:MAG: FIST N-terminal domain-containing protein [Bacteroidia bacterium]